MQDIATGTVMQSATTFLTMMSALSTAVQQLVEHLVKKRSDWLDVALDKDKFKAASDADKKAMMLHESHRTSAIHLISMAIGFALSLSVGLKPLAYLGAGSSWLGQQPVLNSLIAGVMVAFGSSLFDEGLGALREWKKAQEAVRSSIK